MIPEIAYDIISFSFQCVLQAVLTEGVSQSMMSAIELVRCKLTLFYTYWQMNEVKNTNNIALVSIIVVAPPLPILQSNYNSFCA